MRFPFITAALAVTITSTTAVAGERGRPPADGKTSGGALIELREDFGTVFLFPGSQYSRTLGLALPIHRLIPWFGDPKLYEGHLEVDVSRGELEEDLGENLHGMKRDNVDLINDYTKMGVGTTLEFENNKGNALLLRIRKKFQRLNESSGDAEFTYIDDRKANDSGSRLQASVMLDWYLDALYNKPWLQPLGLIQRPYRFWLRTGFEIDKNDLPGARETDQQRFFGLLNFQANPDQRARFLWQDGLEITSPQLIQLGGVFEQNQITGEEDWTWIIGWTPVFRLLNQDNIFRGFGLNKRMYIGGGRPEAKVASEPKPKAIPAKGRVTQPAEVATEVAVVEDQNQNRLYFSIDPQINLLGESTARGIVKRIGKVRSLKGIEKLQEEQANWRVRAVLGYDDGLWELSYAATGMHPLSDLGESHIGQEVRFEYNLRNWDPPSPKDWHDFKVYVSYQRGQFEPNFEDLDLVTAGVSLRF